jgi:nucleolar protein 4
LLLIRPSARSQIEKHLLVRTVAIGNLSPATAPAAAAVARIAGDVERVTDPAPDADVARAHLAADGCGGHVLFVLYPSVREAEAAVTRLHGLPMVQALAMAADAGGGGGGGKNGKKQKGGGTAAAAAGGGEGGGEEGGALWARVVAGEGAQVKKWRIILRNLPFQVRICGAARYTGVCVC